MNRRFIQASLSAFLLLPFGAGLASAPPASPSARWSPEQLAVDVRLFETRSINPDREALRDLHFFIRSDGRGVTASQWLATLAKKVPGTFLAALAFQTLRVEEEEARFLWRLRARSLQMNIRLQDPHPTEAFKAQIETVFSSLRGPLHRFQRQVELQLERTTVFSSKQLELPVRDYLSTFREFPDREHRGLLYEALGGRSVSLVVAVTPRVLSTSELPQLTPETLEPPPGRRVPALDNPLGVALFGTIVVGFEMGSSGDPINPQILRSTVPEVNPRILGEVSRWRFPPPWPKGGRRRWARVAVRLQIP